MKRIIYILPFAVAILIAIHAWSITSTTHTPATTINQAEQPTTTTTENVSLPSTDTTADVLPAGLLSDQALTNDTTLSAASCVRSGCGGILCTTPSEATPPDASCNIQPHFACFDDAVCEVQDSGDCGWTQSDSLSACLINFLPVSL